MLKPASPVAWRPFVTFANHQRLPTAFKLRQYAESGGLLCYGPSEQQLNEMASDYLEKILKGVKPTALPVEQPTRFPFVINLRTAKTLRLTCLSRSWYGRMR